MMFVLTLLLKRSTRRNREGKTRMKKFISYLLVALMVLGTGFAGSQKASAQSTDELEQKIENKKNKQEEIEKEQSNLKNDKQNTEEKIEKNLDKQDSVNSEITTINQKLTD